MSPEAAHLLHAMESHANQCAPDLNALAVFAVGRRRAQPAGRRRPSRRHAIGRQPDHPPPGGDSLASPWCMRTTRSVSLTEAGERLHAEIAPALAEMQAAVDGTRQYGTAVRGQLRLAVSSIAETVLSGPLLAGFAKAHPGHRDRRPRHRRDIRHRRRGVRRRRPARRGDRAGYGRRARLGRPASARRLRAGLSRGHRTAPPSRATSRRIAASAGAGAAGSPLSLGIHRRRPRLRRCPSPPAITTNDMGLMVRLALQRRRHHLRHGGDVPAPPRSRRPRPPAGRLLPALSRLLRLLSEPPEHGAEAARLRRPCAP